SYNNIVFSVPRPLDVCEQGFCISFSGQGIDFYLEYLRKTIPDFSVKQLLSNFLSLADNGDIKCNVSRLDMANDDITYSLNEKPLLNLDVISDSILKNEFTSPFAIKKRLKKYAVTFVDSQRAKLCGLMGDTIYLGSRRSNAFCRIYDKLAESQSKESPIDENINHWVRFEMEFKGCNAMSVAEHIVSLDEDLFPLWYAEVVNNYIRFIDITENNISNYSRCPSKKWWLDFIGTVNKQKLYHVKPVENSFDRSLRWQKKSVFPSIAAMLQCMPVQQYLMLVKETMQSESSIKRQKEIITDFINADKHSPELVGYERYSQYIEDSEYRSFLLQLRKARDENIAAAASVRKLLDKAKTSIDEFLDKHFYDIL
ncbi:MAG: replication initiation factor domain-containing protein, partial [Ruminiclostridium sp.]|nr:replication initiation factor domain-containing protein [Ruminiclostridium sp.]